jgi:Protein of unknown function (DUF3667)
MEDLGKSFPVAEGMVEAEQGTDKKQNNEFCLNCGEKLLDTYCHHCGQKDLPCRQTMRELIENFIGSFYSFESKFFRTVKFLLFKPGFLPVEYTAGKRENYYHPARAYAFISFVFFLLLFSLPDDESKPGSEGFTINDKKELTEGMNQMREGLKKSGLDSTKVDSIYNASIANDAIDTVYTLGSEKKIKAKKNKTNITLVGSDYESIKEYDSAQQLLPASERDGWIMRKLNIRSIELNQRYSGDEARKRFKDDFGQAFLDNFSKVLFFLLPIFALLLKLLYVRKDYYYSEHLVFSIYYYNFFYLAASFYLLVNYIPYFGTLLTTAIVIWAFVYLPLGMKRMYRQSWRKTIFKYGIFLFAFFVCLMLGITGSMMAILMYL